MLRSCYEGTEVSSYETGDLCRVNAKLSFIEKGHFSLYLLPFLAIFSLAVLR